MTTTPIKALLAVLVLSVGFTNSVLADSNQGGAGTIVVANRASGDLSLIDVKTDTVTSVALPGGANAPEPMYVVYKRGRVFVGDRANDRVVVFDAADFSVVDELPAGAGVFHMWSQPNGKQLWVNNDVDNTITVFDLRTHAVIDTLDLPADLVADGGRPHDVILDNQAAYVTVIGLSGANDGVVKYDLRTLEEVARALVGQDPHVTFTPRKNRLFVAAQNGNEVSVLRRKDLSEVAVIPLPGAHGIDATRNGQVVYVTNIPGLGIDAVFAIDVGRNTVLGSVDAGFPLPIPTPHNIVLTGDNRKLYLTHSGATADSVSVFSVSKQSPVPVFLHSVTVGTNPFGIEFVP